MSDNVGDVFSGFLFISTHILLDLLSLGIAEAYIGWGGKLSSHLIASCVKNILTKNYQNLIIGFQVPVKNVGDVFFWDTVYNEMFLIFCLLSSLYKYMKSTTGGFFFVNEQNLLNFSASGW